MAVAFAYIASTSEGLTLHTGAPGCSTTCAIELNRGLDCHDCGHSLLCPDCCSNRCPDCGQHVDDHDMRHVPPACPPRR